VADLQHVDPAEEPARGQHRLHRRLGIPGEQGREAATAQQPDHRSVVDVACGQRAGHIRGGRIQEREDGRPVELDPLPRARRDQAGPGLFKSQLHEARVGRIQVVPTRIEDEADPISLQRRHQPGDVVLVRVGQDHHIDPALPPRQPLAKAPEQQVGVGAAVDQQRAAGRRRDQDRVALPDVQHDQVQAAIRQTGKGERSQ